MPDLMRLAEEVEVTKKPRKLIKDKRAVANLMPVEPTSTSKKQQPMQDALELAGAWGDRDWNEVEAELDRIRHSSKPTPPIEL